MQIRLIKEELLKGLDTSEELCKLSTLDAAYRLIQLMILVESLSNPDGVKATQIGESDLVLVKTHNMVFHGNEYEVIK